MTKKVKKEIQIVLKQSIPNLGKAGSLSRVKSGYARNYLIPQQIGELATQTTIETLKVKQKDLEAKEQAHLELCKKNKLLLENFDKWIIQKRVGNDNKIFGKITLKQVRDILEKETNLDLKKTVIEIPDIKELGTYNVIVTFHPLVKANLKIEILPQ